MHFGTKSWSKIVVRRRYADLSIESSKNVYVPNVKGTYATYLSIAIVEFEEWSMASFFSDCKVPGSCENLFANYRINYQKLCDITKELNCPIVSIE